jgi:hypothetical protein
MADELNIPTHRYYQPRYNVALAKEDISAKYIYDSGIRKIDARIGEVEVREPLFLNSEPGAWYDPSDLTTMFQDRAGSTPVTTPGQSVGLRLDKSKGLVLGPELVTNGDFSGGSTGWTLGTGWSITNGEASFTATGSSSALTQDNVVPLSGFIRFKVSVTRSAGTLSLRVGGGAPVTYSFLASGDYDLILPVAGVNASISFSAGTTFTGSIDNISVRELPGFHAVANSDAARGIYGIEPVGGRRNLLLRTEEFDNAVWAKANTTVTANSAVAPDGTTTSDKVVATNTASATRAVYQNFTAPSTATYTISFYAKAAEYSLFAVQEIGGGRFGASFNLTAQTTASLGGSGFVSSSITSVGNGWFRCTVVWNGVASTGYAVTAIGYPAGASVSAAGTSYAGDGTSGILIWGAQLETGSTATAYQRVTTQYDVTEAGKQTLHYVQYDGADDGYVTPTITPNTDKVQVFAGVRKLSDGGFSVAGFVLETSPASGGNNGNIYLAGPNASRRWDFRSKGTTAREALTTSAAFNAPVSNVLAGLGDISAPSVALRANGTQLEQNTASQGTGNYLAYPLYIGRRGGATDPFNGRDYGLIVRFGPNLDANTISNVEKYLAQKTGVTL